MGRFLGGEGVGGKMGGHMGLMGSKMGGKSMTKSMPNCIANSIPIPRLISEAKSRKLLEVVKDVQNLKSVF